MEQPHAHHEEACDEQGAFVGGLLLALGLFHGEVTDNGQFEPLAFAGFQDGDDPQGEETEADHHLKHGKHKEDQAKTGYHGDEHRQNQEDHPNGKPGHGESDGLEGVEADQRDPVVGFDDEEEDRRDDGDVGERGGGVWGNA